MLDAFDIEKWHLVRCDGITKKVVTESRIAKRLPKTSMNLLK